AGLERQHSAISHLRFFFAPTRQQLSATLFPYTTLFRSLGVRGHPTPLPPGPGSAVSCRRRRPTRRRCSAWETRSSASCTSCRWRSEEHTSELQSRGHLVCRLLLEKKKAI